MNSAAARFEELHREGTFLLVNVHDAGSAVVAEAAGAVALGTTSSGHAYTLARRDAVGALSREEAIQRAAEICQAVSVPVSVDAENGWGHEPFEVAETIRQLADIGAAGASIEDWSGDPARGFYDRDMARARVEAAVETARSLSDPFVICARAEAFLHGAPEPLAEAIARLQSFAEVGADCLYAPGPRDRETLARIVEEAGGPVNALIGIGSRLTMEDARRIGVRRVSVGGSLYRATMAVFRDLVRQITASGVFTTEPTPLETDTLEELFE
ncbi:MAG: isocitrate lyase/PEP mutase family protein [Acidimicrobiia bacterium]